jgi:hypothetical protein
MRVALFLSVILCSGCFNRDDAGVIREREVIAGGIFAEVEQAGVALQDDEFDKDYCEAMGKALEKWAKVGMRALHVETVDE